MRINTPQRNLVNLEQVLIYLLGKIGGFANFELGLIKNLLYFIDIDHYELNEVQLMGLEYKKVNSELYVSDLDLMLNRMIKSEKIEVVECGQKLKVLPLVNPELSLLNGAELKSIDFVVTRYANKSLSELAESIALDCPFKVAKNGSSLEYEHAFYRHDRFCVREYEVL
jgi:hypothetical protein